MELWTTLPEMLANVTLLLALLLPRSMLPEISASRPALLAQMMLMVITFVNVMEERPYPKDSFGKMDLVLLVAQLASL